MENEIHRKIAERIAQHLPTYQELIRKRSSVERRLDRAEEQKGTVKHAIFEKVQIEYQSELEKLAADLKPVEEEIDEIRAMIGDETARIEAEATALEDQLEELQFRSRVGEYDANELQQRCAPVNDALAKLRQQRQELDKQLEQLDAVPFAEDDIEVDTQPVAPNNDAPLRAQPDPTATGEEIDFASLSLDTDDEPRRPTFVEINATGAGSASAAPAESNSVDGGTLEEDVDMVNPADWMQEFEQEDRREEEHRRAADRVGVGFDGNNGQDGVKTGSEDAGTRVAKNEPSQNVAVETEPARADDACTELETGEIPKGFPVLIITKGSGAGKKLPLVPMTMTLGREHDNNIEIKDEDVARYHARIAYERGKYIIQDLESSSGTWVNDSRLSKPAPLAHGDKIRLGNTELMIDFD